MALNLLPLNHQANPIINRVIAEPYALANNINTKPYTVIALKEGAFFGDTFEASVLDGSSNLKTLVKGVDYYLGLKWIDASKKCMQPVHACAVINANLVGTLRVSYNAVGGDFGLKQADLDLIKTMNELQVKNNSLEALFYNVIVFPSITNPWSFSNASSVYNTIKELKKNNFMPSVVKV